MNKVRKMQTAAGGPIKRQKDGYRYIPNEHGGWDRISDNSVSDVFATMEFTPNKTKVGSSITRKLSTPSKTYYSAYNPDDVVKGFNILTLGGLNNLSPTLWVRRAYDTGKLLTGNMTWSGYTDSWINGNNGLVSLKFSEEHPYISTGINLVGDGIGFGKIASNLSKTPGVYYHGSPTKGLTTLEPRNGLLWITDSKSGATLYGGGITGKGSLYKINNIDLGDNILTVNGKFHSPFKVPLKDLPENVLDYLPKDKYAYIDRIADAARLAGYSSVLFKNVLDFGGKGASINPFHSYMYKQTAIFNPINVTSESVSPISRISGFRQGGQVRKMLTAAGGPLFPWQLNTEWVNNWRFRTTPASRSRVLSGKGVETDKQYTERRKKEETKRTWRSDAADIAHGIGEGVLALHPYTAIPYFGAKVGLDFLNGTYGWHTALNASVPLFHMAPQAVGLREATNVALEDAANAGSKTARNWRIAREIKLATKNKPNTEVPKPIIRTKIGDVEIDNPGLYYHQSDAGKAKNFVSTGRMRTPLEESWLAKEEAGEHIPIKIRSGIVPGYPQDPGSAMFAQGKLWYGLTSNKPDLLVTAREMPIANKNASVMSNKASLRQLEAQGTRRVTNDNIYTQGPHNRQNTTAYTWVPGYGYRLVVKEPSTSLAFFERKPSENNIVGASYDYRIEDPKGSMDFLKLFFALLKINGKEYTLEGLKDAANVQQGLPEHIQSYLNLNTVERAVRAMRKNGYSEREIQLYIDKVNEEMNKVKVGMYSDLEYNAAGALDFGGFYNNDLNFISVNKDAYLSNPKFTSNYILKHEGRHLIDYNTSMTDDVINILEKAYDKDFLEIPKHEDAGNLKNYLHMDRERVTTNRDARDVLLSNLEKHPGEFLNLTKFAQTSPGKYKDMVDFLNELILYAEPEDIISAVENSNGYGKRYINYLKKNNKLTSTKIEQLRLAMIHVPSYLLPVAGGYTVYNIFNQPKQQLQYQKQGGKMNILEFLKNGSGIHIKEKNKGKFTSYCGGKVTDECILKGKNSSNPAIRKRAVFAANARKWKHKEGGTVKALEGTKFNWGSAIGNLASTALLLGISTYMLNKKLSSDAEADKEKYKSEAASKLQKDMQDERTKRFNILNAIKGTSDNPNAFGGGIFEKYFINLGDDEAIRNYNQSISDYNKMIDLQIRAKKAENTGNFLSSLGLLGVGLLANSAFNKNSSTNNSSSTNTNTLYNLNNVLSTPNLSNLYSISHDNNLVV